MHFEQWSCWIAPTVTCISTESVSMWAYVSRVSFSLYWSSISLLPFGEIEIPPFRRGILFFCLYRVCVYVSLMHFVPNNISLFGYSKCFAKLLHQNYVYSMLQGTTFNTQSLYNNTDCSCSHSIYIQSLGEFKNYFLDALLCLLWNRPPVIVERC